MPLARLCEYYLDCLSYDSDNGVSTLAADRLELDYFDPRLTSLAETLANGLHVDGIQAFLRRLSRDRNRKTLVVGYPVRLRHFRARSGRSYYVVEPVMLFELRGSPNDFATSGFDSIPRVNFAHLRSLGMGGTGELMREAIQLTDDLGLAGDTGEIPELDELFRRLHAERPDWDWREAPDVDSLSTGDTLSQLQVEGIYSRAIICGIERSQFTAGLETELEHLKGLPSSSYEGTALGAWIAAAKPTSASPESQLLLEPLPLNSEQRMAVEQALTRPLTAITGPPGTGKSQVVTALLMNAAWNGERILFASKNNKAVDVVEERINGFATRPILLRLGNSEHRSALAGNLASLLGSRATAIDHEDYQTHLEVHQSLTQQRAVLAQRLERVIALRNRTDQLEQRVEGFRQTIGDDLLRAAAQVPRPQIQQIRTASDRVRSALHGADKSNQPLPVKFLWLLLRSGRNNELAKSKLELRTALEQAQLLGLTAAPQVTDSPAEWKQFADRAVELSDDCLQASEYFSSLAQLQREGNPVQVAGEQTRLAKALVENSNSLWRAWLHLLPERLSPEKRRALSDFSSVLELIVSAEQERPPVEREVYRSYYEKYYELFHKVADVLPCWAVTSLSARGRLPMQAGIFDLLVIDEASQCDIASALPLLYRSKRAVIIGDPQQLRHISALSSAKDMQLLSQHGVNEEFLSWSYSAHSLFDLANGLCGSEDRVTLRDHHRSHADIIGFSNERFYEGRLRVATNYSLLRIPQVDDPAIRWVDLRGRVVRPSTGGAVNEAEAQGVVEELKRLLLQGYRGAIGVVSPFRAQANRIREILERDGDTAQRLSLNDCLIDTVHRFQGDERDVMFFSPVVADGISPNALHFLRDNGNLFNVAITRARSALVVVGDKSAAVSSGVEYLQRFVAYVEAIGNGRASVEVPSLFEPGLEYPSVSRPERVSDWERYLYRSLYQAGHRPIPQYTVDQYDLDFALFGAGDRRLNIEVDGERYHRNWDGELTRRDQMRNQRLMEMGWDVIRFWVYEIRDDLSGCLARIDDWVAKNEPGGTT